MSNGNAATRRAFSMVEMVVAMTITTVLILSASTAVALSARAIDPSNIPALKLLESTDALNMLTSDLRLATSFIDQRPTSVTFMVPDRTGDGKPERIRYNWLGSVGDDLLRQINDGPVVAIASDVYAFDLSYLVRTVIGTGTFGSDESRDPGGGSEEVLLASYTDLGSGKLNDTRIETNKVPGVYIEPNLDPGAASWSLRRLVFRLKIEGSADGSLKIQVRAANPDGTPTETIISSTLVAESNFGSAFDWVDIPIDPATNLDPATGVCVILVHATGDRSGKVEWVEDGAAMPEGSAYMYSSDAGSSWNPLQANQELLFYAYGTIE